MHTLSSRRQHGTADVKLHLGFCDALQVKQVADMLLPALETFAAQPHLVDNAIRIPGAAGVSGSGGSFSSASSTPPASNNSLSSAAGASGNASSGSLSAVAEPRGVAPAVAAAAAMLQLRVLEVFFFLPGAGLWSKCHGVLINLCTMQISGVAGGRVSLDAAAAVAGSSLRHMMNNQDAVLGPWLPSRDVLEDELRHYSGELRVPILQRLHDYNAPLQAIRLITTLDPAISMAL
jgi:hypothetical protein